MTLANVVRLNMYVTDADALFEQWEVGMGRLQAAGVQPAGTVLVISRLAFPGSHGRNRGYGRRVTAIR